MVPSFSNYLEAKAAFYNEAGGKYKFIPNRHPVRDAVAKLVTDHTNQGWKKPGEALTAIQDVLSQYGFQVPHPSFVGSDKFVHPEGKDVVQRFALVKVLNPHDPFSETEHMDSQLIFSYNWRRDPMQHDDARCEVNAYIS